MPVVTVEHTQVSFVAQRKLNSTGDWYDIKANGKDHSGDPKAALYASAHLCEQNAIERVQRGDLGVVTEVRIVQVLKTITFRS